MCVYAVQEVLCYKIVVCDIPMEKKLGTRIAIMPVVARTITYNSLVYTYYDEPATEYRKVTNRIIHFRPTKNLNIVSFTNGTDVVIHLETGHPVCAFNCACAHSTETWPSLDP